jgi:thiol-disulfide isomerase/thioredoxin
MIGMKLTKVVLALFFSLTLMCANAGTTFHDAHGNKIKASQFNGKWVIINYWASWCNICLNEIPEFNNFYKKVKNKNVLIYGVNYDHLTGDDLTQAMSAADIQYPVLVEDPTSIYNLGDFGVVPVTFVINPQGKIVKKIIGPTTENALMDIIS